MPTFNSVADLNRYLSSSNGQQMLFNQDSIKRALQSEAERLQKYLIEEIDKHLMSYQPIEYHRTGAWLESIRMSPVKRVGNEFIISITFDDQFAYHPSVIGGEDGYVPWLMEVGWKDHSYSTPHFKGFKGTHYIKNAVERWNRDNKFGFKIRVYHGKERYL
ncbi:hypothetical protein [Paenibacillus elgii]|uniref:hypothetical protein n=1 Tax=Paenibacillus elgii TaxID=189691 RepID=UPI00203EAC4A|nr:hypothetical protein [Paenibacillus elgii]MCM3274164.1 hypothetical protein [Paenibacillus elgii]